MSVKVIVALKVSLNILSKYAIDIKPPTKFACLLGSSLEVINIVFGIEGVEDLNVTSFDI